jgi:hypothetical protein
MKQIKMLAVAAVATVSFAWLATARAEPRVHADRVANQTAQGGLALRSGAAFNGSNVDAAGQRRLLGDGQGNVSASGNSGFTTASGSTGQRSTRFTRSADGTAAGERHTTATNANTGVTFDASTAYTQGSGISRSATCKDAAGNTVACGSAR